MNGPDLNQLRLSALSSPGRTPHLRLFEWLAEKIILLVALSAILLVFLIFVFVARESLPILLGQLDTRVRPLAGEAVTLDQLSVGDLARLLDLSVNELQELDRETLGMLLEEKVREQAAAAQHPDADVNSLAWRNLLLPRQWSGYPQSGYIWQPVSRVPKYNIVPLLVGSLKATLVALLFAVPLALAAAVYVSQLASARMREILKPTIELLTGIPSVVLGFFALVVLATALQQMFNYTSRLNAFVAGVALGIALIPLVFSLAEDALSSVPRRYSQAALALGASRWQAAWRVVLPAALPGVFAAVVLGFARALGETMIVLMVSGNASIMSWNPLDSARTVTATIAAELAETVYGGHHYRMLFLLGTLLFAVTFVANLVADLVMSRLKTRLEGGA